MSTSAVEMPGAPAGLSQGERIVKTFLAPQETFADIRRSASWWAPFLVMSLFTLIFAYAVDKKVTFQKVSDSQMKMASSAQLERMEQVPPEQRAKIMEQQVTVTKIITYAFPVFTIIWLLIVALVLWGTFSFGAGATEINFGRSMAIVTYASLIGIIKTLLTIILLFAGMDVDEFNIQNPIGTNPGFFMNFQETPRFLYAFASGLDVFLFAVLAMTAYGFHITGRIKKGTAFGIVFGWYFAFLLVSAGLGAAFA